MLSSPDADQRVRVSRRPCLLLLFVTASSLVFLTAIDLPLYRIAARLAPGFAWIPDARLTSLLASAALYVWLRPPQRCRSSLKDVPPWRGAALLLLSGAWLIVTAIADFVVHVYLPPVHGASAVAAFLLCGAVAEELLFRGAVFGLAKQVWGKGWKPVLLSAAAFSLAHLQYHSFRLTPQAWAQIGYTLPMGTVFGILRWKSRRLWPSAGLHIANNCLALAASKL